MVNKHWLQRRFYEARLGHTNYFGFFISMGTFVIVAFAYISANLPFILNLFPHITIFAAFALAIYLPVVIIVGHLHLQKQIPIENIRMFERNPYFAKMFRLQLQLLSRESKLSKEEVLGAIEDLKKIESSY